MYYFYLNFLTAKRILERLHHRLSKFDWSVCIPESKANFLFFWHFYGLVFYIESIGVRWSTNPWDTLYIAGVVLKWKW